MFINGVYRHFENRKETMNRKKNERFPSRFLQVLLFQSQKRPYKTEQAGKERTGKDGTINSQR